MTRSGRGWRLPPVGEPLGGSGRLPLEGVTIGHIGHFDPTYARNRTMAKALRRAGATVITLTDPRRYPTRTPALLARGRREALDLLLVGFPGHADVAAAKALGLAKGVPVIFDAFVSLWETTEDRGRRLSRLGSRRIEDWVSCRLADIVLLDTATHADFFRDWIGVPVHRLRTAWVGSDDELFHPRPRVARPGFRVLFYGTFIPLHGVDTILRAAKLLQDAGDEAEFVLVGAGQTYGSARALADRLHLTAVRFEPRMQVDVLAAEIARSDLCLGIFGDSPKAARVIPNKVFDALAMARPVVTADTPAAREVLVHGANAWLCPAGDPRSLADAIRALRADEGARLRMATAGYELFRSRFSLEALSSTMAGIVRELVPAKG